MSPLRFSSIGDIFRQFYEDTARKVREINKKYAHPRVKMTPAVRMTLIVLRVYLLTLVGIMLFKFITMLHS